MSKNRGVKNSRNFNSSKTKSDSRKSKSKSDFKARDKPKYKSGARPNNRSRDRGEVRSRGRPSHRSRSKPNYRSSSRTSNRYDDRNRSHSERGTKELHSTICSECKRQTKVPFKPTGVKPVYCRECYQKHKPPDSFKNLRGPSTRSSSRQGSRTSDRSSGRYDNRTRSRTDSRTKQLHTTICAKCKKETQVPFKPTGAKPVYCRECFQDQKPKTESTPKRVSNQVKDDEVVERYGDRGGPYRENKRMHSTTCRTCKKEILIPFKPKAKKLIYCQDCFQEVGKKK
jgi:CxxC-x17-CxxC domain-containing protein